MTLGLTHRMIAELASPPADAIEGCGDCKSCIRRRANDIRNILSGIPKTARLPTPRKKETLSLLFPALRPGLAVPEVRHAAPTRLGAVSKHGAFGRIPLWHPLCSARRPEVVHSLW